jgi:hypothetical protein
MEATNSEARDLLFLTTILFVAAIIFIAACSLHFSSKIKSKKIPMQWGTNGQPTWLAPRLLGLWWQCGFTLLVGGVLYVVASQIAIEKIPALCASIAILSISTGLAQLFHLRAVVRWEANNNTGS